MNLLICQKILLINKKLLNIFTNIGIFITIWFNYAYNITKINTNNNLSRFGFMVKNRKEKILELLRENKFLTIEELSNLLKVSENTIRRDIDTWGQNEKLLMVKGGSVLLGSQKKSSDPQEFSKKNAIGTLASSFIKEGDIIIIDGGTTTKQIVPHLADKKDITIYSPSFEVAQEIYLLDNPGITFIMLGGVLDYKVHMFVSDYNFETLKEFNFNKGFLSVSGIDINNGVTDHNLPYAKYKNIIMNRASSTFFLIDSSKFGITSIKKVCDITQVDNLITDKNIAPEDKELFEGKVNKLYIADY